MSPFERILVASTVCLLGGLAHAQTSPIDVRVTDSNDTQVNVQVNNGGPAIVLTNPDADWTSAMLEALAERVAAQRPSGTPLSAVLQRTFERIRSEDGEARKALAAVLLRDIKLMLELERYRLIEQLNRASDDATAQLAERIAGVEAIQEQHQRLEQQLFGQLSDDTRELSKLTAQGNELLGRVITRDNFVLERESARIGLALQGSWGVRQVRTIGGSSLSSIVRVAPSVRVRFWPMIFEISVPTIVAASEVSGGFAAPVGETLLSRDKRRPRTQAYGLESAVGYSFALSDWNVVAAGVRGGFGCITYEVPYGGCYWTLGPAGWVELALLPAHGVWLGLDLQYAFGMPVPVRRYTGVGADSTQVWSDAPELRIGAGYAATFN